MLFCGDLYVYLKVMPDKIQEILNSRKGKYILLFLVLSAVFILPVILVNSAKKQKSGKLAQASGEVRIDLTSQKAVLKKGENFDVYLSLNKISTRNFKVSGAQAVITADDKVQFDSAECLPPFDSMPYVRIDNQQITVMCAVSLSQEGVILPDQQLNFARIYLTVNKTVGGKTVLFLGDTKVIEAGVAGQAPDLSVQSGSITLPGSYFTFTLEGPLVLSNIYFEPSDLILTSETPMKIMANFPGQNIAFGRIVFTFDPAKIQLSTEIASNPNLSTIVEKTSKAIANQQGKVVLVEAASPSDSQPSGIFELVNFSIVPVPGANSDPASMNFVIQDMQIVDSNGALISLVPTDATVKFVYPTPTIGGATITPAFTITPEPTNIYVTDIPPLPTLTPIPTSTLQPSPTEGFPTVTGAPTITTGPSITESPPNETPFATNPPLATASPGETASASPTIPLRPPGLISAPGNPCSKIRSTVCFREWKDEFIGKSNKKVADFDEDGDVDSRDLWQWVVNLITRKLDRRQSLPR